MKVCKFHINGKKLTQVDEYVYLGKMLINSRKWMEIFQNVQILVKRSSIWSFTYQKSKNVSL